MIDEECDVTDAPGLSVTYFAEYVAGREVGLVVCSIDAAGVRCGTKLCQQI